MTGTARFCQECGAPLVPQSKFCEECGKPVVSGGLTNFTRVRELFDKAVELEPSRREAWLEQQCAGDLALLAEVRGMLPRSLDDSYLERPAQLPPSLAPPSTPPPAAAGVFQTIGPYRLLRELGRGGMGVVYLAARDDGAFRKNVALKLLLREQTTPEFIQRFKQERQVLAAMDHPNVARILDAGDAPDGMPFYVMEYVEGRPVDKYCDEERLTLTARIKIFQQICQAVHYLHQNSIVHRDLKPANILVSNDGLVKLLDFGIAKVVGAGAYASPDVTSVQGYPMTPNYASPEQIQGITLQKTSDIYSLGVILYLLLTGQPPYASWADKQDKLAARQSPPPPSANIREDLRASPESTAQLRKAMLGDLDSIVLMALRYDLKERYQSAADLSNDLQRFLDGQSVTAHPDSVGRRSRRILSRKRAAIGVFAGFLALGGFGVWQWRLREGQKSESAAREAQLRQVLDQLEAAIVPDKPDSEKLQDVQKLMKAFQSEFPAIAANQARGSGPPQTLLARGVRYLDRLVAGGPRDVDLGVTVSDAYRQLGKLEENVSPTPAAAVQTYQKGAQVLNACLVIPGGAKAAERLVQMNQLIERLGGQAVPSSAHAADPAVAEPAEPAVAEPVNRAPAPQPRSLPNAPKTTRTNAARQESPLAPTPMPDPPMAPRGIPSSAALDELRDRFVTVESRIAIAEQTIEPLKRQLESQGQTLNADTLTAMSSMRVRLNQAKRELAAGNEAGARESLGAAQALADRVLRTVGR